MALSRIDISDGLINELRNFEQLVRSLSPAELDAPSRCSGWTVGDVARHAMGGIADVTASRLDGLGSPEVTAREVAERAGHTAAQLADECATVATAAAGLLSVFDDASWAAPAGNGYEGTLGQGVEALWYDTWLHGDDIRSASAVHPNSATGSRRRWRMSTSNCASATGPAPYQPSTTPTRWRSSSPRPAAPTARH